MSSLLSVNVSKWNTKLNLTNLCNPNITVECQQSVPIIKNGAKETSNYNWTINKKKQYFSDDDWKSVDKSDPEWRNFVNDNPHIEFRAEFSDFKYIDKFAEDIINHGILDEERAIRCFLTGFLPDHEYTKVGPQKCANCYKVYTLTIDHILAITLCGGTEFNTCLLCFDCNQLKANKFNRACFSFDKLHPRFARQLTRMKIDCSKLSDKQLMFTLCKLATSYRSICIQIYRKRLLNRKHKVRMT